MIVALRGILETIRELFQFFWVHGLWWFIPVIIVLLSFAVLIALGSATGLGPLIYTLF